MSGETGVSMNNLTMGKPWENHGAYNGGEMVTYIAHAIEIVDLPIEN